MKDPGTSFGAWFQQVKAREQAGSGSGGLGGSRASAGNGGRAGSSSGGVVNKLMFWRSAGGGSSSQGGSGSGRQHGESGTDVERGGLLPSFMRTPGRDTSNAGGSWLDCCDCGLSTCVPLSHTHARTHALCCLAVRVL